MSTPEHAPHPIRRRYRAYDLADDLQKALINFTMCVMNARRHLADMRIEKSETMRRYHADAARSEGKCARICWEALLEAGYEDRKGVLRA